MPFRYDFERRFENEHRRYVYVRCRQTNFVGNESQLSSRRFEKSGHYFVNCFLATFLRTL